MAAAVVIDVPHGNQGFYDQIIPTLFPQGTLPPEARVAAQGRARLPCQRLERAEALRGAHGR